MLLLGTMDLKGTHSHLMQWFRNFDYKRRLLLIFSREYYEIFWLIKFFEEIIPFLILLMSSIIDDCQIEPLSHRR